MAERDAAACQRTEVALPAAVVALLGAVGIHAVLSALFARLAERAEVAR